MILECEQGSIEWLQLRCGKVTASRMADVLAEIKKGEAAARRNYRAQIVSEILTNVPQDDAFVSREMQWGRDNEQFARTAYELKTDASVEPAGFAIHPEIPRFGASADGLVTDSHGVADGVLEIKCPNTSTHLECLLTGAIPPEHYPQMRAELACTGRAWVDFVSFDPRLPSHLQLFVKRFHRDEVRIAEMEAKVVEFLGEVDDVLQRLNPDLTPLLVKSLELVRGGQPVVPIAESVPEEWEANF